MDVPRRIRELAHVFERNREAYRSGRYKEAQLRAEFIDPFFESLGWDVHNKQGYAEPYKDVIHEDAIKIGGATKAPDYCFRIGGTRKFFVEAKKPSVDIKDAVHPAYQLRRYAWSAKLPLSILTDFEEFAAYDCRIKPGRTDKASAARVLYITYPDYAQRWDEIASIFSRDAVLKGSFDKYVESTKRKRGTAEVDAAFLKEIESWREMLARNIALRNPDLTRRELNFAVQRTIDRIIFLRICEDRAIEHYGQLMALQNGPNVYARLCNLFYRADERYNSGLFYFRKEKGRTDAPDELTPRVRIDDKPLKEIVKRLYYPESPYEFSVLPADILGQVYEQFLGKVIRLTPAHRAVVEDKPEVKKAGGVYYTPTYIVDYIVKNTVGKLLGSQGLGSGGSGSGKGEAKHGAEELSGPQRLEKSDGLSRGSVPPDEGLSSGGEIRIDQPASKSGGINSGEHRRGVRQDTPGGLCTSSLDCQGITNGSRDAPGDSREAGLGGSTASLGDMGPVPAGRQDAHEAHRGSEAPPDPQPLNPNEAAKLRILDPACGSGSFLIGAYQYLLDWHLDWYTTHNPQKWARKRNPPIYQTLNPKPQPPTPDPAPLTPDPRSLTPSPTWRLTVSERKRILLDNIYGVDIDAQAVEVTKLSLLLKVLEGQSHQTIDAQYRFFRERALPDLSGNIKCGNSLIGPDFYDNQQMTILDDEERYRINAFDWNAEFPEIMKSGGFDAVIGNPPYVFTRERMSPAERHYYGSTYPTSWEKHNTYMLFMERMLALIRPVGTGSFIVPNSWLTIESAKLLRHKLIPHIRVLSDLNYRAFTSVSMEPCIFVVAGSDLAGPVSVIRARDKETFLSSKPTNADRRRWVGGLHRIFFSQSPGAEKLIDRVVHASSNVGVSFDVRSGLQAYERSRGSPPQTEEDVRRHVFDRAQREDKNSYKYLQGRDVARFRIGWSGQWLQYGPWLSQPRKLSIFTRPRVLVREITAKLPRCISACYTDHAYLNNKSVLNVLHRNDSVPGLLCLAGALNSRLISLFYSQRAVKSTRNIFPKIVIRNLREFPYPQAPESGRVGRVASLVGRIMQLQIQMAAAKTAHDKTVLQRQIDKTDKQIDQLVYELYGLTDDEIKIVEQATT